MGVCGPVWAQQSHGYLLVAPGGATVFHHTRATLHGGAGAEAVLGKGCGAGLELGALGTTAHFTDTLAGVLSANGYYHFRHTARNWDPLPAAGYSFMFRGGQSVAGCGALCDRSHLFNLGGGFQYWHGRAGLKIELRDHVRPSTSVPAGPHFIQEIGATHYWEARLGLAFH